MKPALGDPGTVKGMSVAGSLIDALVEASGGEAALRRFTSLRAEIMVDTGEALVQGRLYWRSPRVLRIEIQTGSETAVRVYDGLGGFAFVEKVDGQKQVVPLSVDPVADLRRMAEGMSPAARLLDYKQRGDKVEYLGTDHSGSDELNVLKWTRSSGETNTEFLDQRTNLPRKCLTTILVDGQARSLELAYSDYRTVGGVLTPFVVTLRTVGSDESQVLRLVTATAGIDLDDRLFSP